LGGGGMTVRIAGWLFVLPPGLLTVT